MKTIIALGITMSLFSISQYSYGTAMKKTQEITIGLGGDTMLGRLVNDVITTHGYDWPWGTMLPILQSTDINLVNLETTLTGHTIAVPKVFNFRADPDKVKSLINARIDVVNLANNHSLDFGPLGLLETLDVLHKSNIVTIGAGKNHEQAAAPAIIEKKGIRIGFFGCSDNEPDWLATTDKPGINYIKVGDIGSIKKIVKKLRPHVDLIILSIHWGPNMREHPTKEFQQFAHEIIDSGVDILHGHSAHIPQGIEAYKNKLILYDTGDFIDDYAIDKRLRNDQSCFFIVKAQKNKLLEVTLIPTIIENMQVLKAQDPLAGQILERLRTLSKLFNTLIDQYGRITLHDK